MAGAAMGTALVKLILARAGVGAATAMSVAPNATHAAFQLQDLAAGFDGVASGPYTPGGPLTTASAPLVAWLFDRAANEWT